jgi:DtxR family Mn-dependent transcriptional regulator
VDQKETGMKPPDVERVEELCEEIWSLTEAGDSRVSRVTGGSKVEDAGGALEEVVRRGLARLDADRVVLTDEGRTLASAVVRRHRLAEVLFTQVLELEERSRITACDLEHVCRPK